MTFPIEPTQPQVTPAVPVRRIERTERDRQRERHGGEDLRDQASDDEQESGEEPGLHVDVLA